MSGRRWAAVACLAIGFTAAGVFVAYAVVRPEDREDQAVGAAINALEGDDPNVGTWGSCEHEPGFGALRLRARYKCVVRSCELVLARLDVTDDLLDGWTFQVTSTRHPELYPAKGEIEPVPSTTITELDEVTRTEGICAEP